MMMRRKKEGPKVPKMGPCGDRPGAPPQNTFDLTPSAQLFLHNANTRKILLFPPPITCTNMKKN
jgi:hypothetical protein